jgi:hypothetical protein
LNQNNEKENFTKIIKNEKKIKLNENENEEKKKNLKEKEEKIRLNVIFEKSKQNIEILWEELKIPEYERIFFRKINFNIKIITIEFLTMLGNEIQNLRNHRKTTLRTLKNIEKRENIISKLNSFFNNFNNDESKKLFLKKNFEELILRYKLSSLDVVESILNWRNDQNSPKSFIWRNKDYLIKMRNDIDFIFENPNLLNLLDEYFERIKQNPLIISKIKKIEDSPNTKKKKK